MRRSVYARNSRRRSARCSPIGRDCGLVLNCCRQNKQLGELRDRLKEFQEIANTYGAFKGLALQLATLLKASTTAQETISASIFSLRHSSLTSHS